MVHCAICQEPARQTDRYPDWLGRAYFFPCMHHFHEMCLNTHLNKTVCMPTTQSRINCPICDKPVELNRHLINLGGAPNAIKR